LLMVGTASDITDEVRLQKELEQSHDMMRQVIEHSKSAIAVHDKDLNYLFVSQRYLDEYEVKDRDIIGKHHYEVFPDLPRKWRDVHKRVLKGEVVRANRDVYKRKDGTTEYTDWECRPLYGADESIEGMIVYTEIITDRIRRERELEASRNTFTSMLDRIPIGIAIHSSWPNADIVYMNDLYPELLGTNRKTLEHARSVFEVVVEDERERQDLLASIEDMFKKGISGRMTWHNVPIRKDGRTIRCITVSVDRIDGSDLYVVSLFAEKEIPPYD
ncbi:MAG: PAS domain-containing protein, partial [Acholeplasmataceae bacterium]